MTCCLIVLHTWLPATLQRKFYLRRERVGLHPFPQSCHRENILITTLKGLQSLCSLSKVAFGIEILGFVAVRELSTLSAQGRLTQGALNGPCAHPFEQGPGSAAGFLLAFVSEHQRASTTAILVFVFLLEQLF